MGTSEILVAHQQVYGKAAVGNIAVGCLYSKCCRRSPMVGAGTLMQGTQLQGMDHRKSEVRASPGLLRLRRGCGTQASAWAFWAGLASEDAAAKKATTEKFNADAALVSKYLLPDNLRLHSEI